MKADGDIVPLPSSQQQMAWQALARAFYDYPLIEYLFPGTRQRERVLPWFMGFAVRYCLKYGEVFTTPAFEGVAAWVRPAYTRFSWRRHIESGLLQMPFRIGLGAFRRTTENDYYVEVLRHHYAPRQHWYLLALGVVPACRGKGIGEALLEPVLAKASKEETACYLETHSETNLAFYGRFGFEVVHAGEVPGRGLRVWAMLRKPPRN
jgi:ribosomal protein S18 acetylase RimI-like enzyme